MTGSTSVSVLVPLAGASSVAAAAREGIERYLETIGFTFEVIVPEERSCGAAIRKGVSEATGSVVVIVDAPLPYSVSAIGDAVAMIDSGATEVVFGSSAREPQRAPALIRWLLVHELPDSSLRFKAFSSTAAKLVVAETKLEDESCDLEIGYLVNKYGFRVERLTVETVSTRSRRAPSIFAALKIRLIDRRMGYRAARRCPVCLSSEVWTFAQIPGNVIRACSRCKCRYLNQFAEEDDGRPVRRVLRAHAPSAEPADEPHSESARDRTTARRMGVLRKHLTSRARVLEIGVRDGTFGVTAAREFEYVGIDSAAVVARHARSLGLEAYCATLEFREHRAGLRRHRTLPRVREYVRPARCTRAHERLAQARWSSVSDHV